METYGKDVPLAYI